MIDNKNNSAIHPDLLLATQLAYKPCGLSYEKLVKEAESEEYAACRFEMNNRRIAFRVGKITPTKIGHFVTFWKRIGSGPIMPYDMGDLIDLFVVSVRSAKHFGQFVFPKSVLHEKDVISKAGQGGKRAIRVYPPWDITESKQAQKTQSWQLKYFFQICSKKGVDIADVRRLFL